MTSAVRVMVAGMELILSLLSRFELPENYPDGVHIVSPALQPQRFFKLFSQYSDDGGPDDWRGDDDVGLGLPAHGQHLPPLARDHRPQPRRYFRKRGARDRRR